MARMHGKDVRVYLRYADISAHIGEIDPSFVAETHDRTTFANAGWRAFDPGLRGWEGSFQGFYDNSALVNADFSAANEAMLGQSPAENQAAIISIYDGEADAVGERGILLPAAVLSRLGRPTRVGDLVTERIALRGSGRAGLNGVLLHPSGAETATGNGSSVDNAASSASGGRGTLHALALAGTWTFKIQHSADNSAWSDLITFTQVAGSQLAETKEVSGTVNRYLRAIWTEDVAGTATFVVGFARY